MKELIIILALFVILLIGGIFGLNVLRCRYSADEAKLEAITKAKDLCEKLLAQVALALFTEAERKFGDGTGKLKMSYVLERFLAMLPDWVQELITADWLTAKLEALLLEAKEEWQKNSKLLGDIANDNKN